MSPIKKITGKISAIIVFIMFLPFLSQGQKILTLEDAMAVAVKNSPDIIKAELDMTINKENLNAREAATKSLIKFQLSPFNYSETRSFVPQFSTWYTSQTKMINGDFVVSQPIKLTDGRITLQNHLEYKDAFSDYNDTRFTGYSNDLFVKYSQPLFTYNTLKMELDRLEMALENSTLSYSIQRLYLERLVTQYFYNVYQKIMSLDIAREELKNQETGYEIIKSKVEGGLSAMEELLQAELNLATSESNLQNKQMDLENAKDEFRQYIGMPLGEEFDIQANVEFSQVPVDMNKAIENGLSARLELRQREIEIKNSYHNLTVAKSTNEFAGSVDLSIGLFGENPKLAEVYDKPTRSPQMMVTFNIPIWDWGERKSRIKAAQAGIRIDEINLENQRTSIELAIRQTYRSLQNLSTQMELAQQNVKNAQLTYEINLERYKNGDLTSMDLGRFQNQLSEKKMNLANSLISYKLELLNMKIQSLWDFENNTSFVPKEIQNNLKER